MSLMKTNCSPRDIVLILGFIVSIWGVNPMVNLHAQLPIIAEPKTPISLIDQLLATENYKGSRLPPRARLARAIAKDTSISPKIRVDVLTTILRHEIENPCPVTHFIHGGYATPTVYIQGQYIFALRDVGAEAIPHLRKHSEQLKVSVQNISLSLGNTESLNVKELQYTLIALGWLGDKEVFPDILEILENEKIDGYMRQKAAMALGEINNRAAIPALKRALKDDFHVNYTSLTLPKTSYPVRGAAVSALRKFGFEFDLINDRQQWEYRIVKEP